MRWSAVPSASAPARLAHGCGASGKRSARQWQSLGPLTALDAGGPYRRRVPDCAATLRVPGFNRVPQLLTLSRAARLVGITRGALQSRIKAGELAAFEGMVSAEDLLRAYPETRLDDNTAFERFAQIKDNAFSRRVREHVLPKPEVLVARLTDMSRRLAQSEAGLDYYRSIVEHLQTKLHECDNSAAASARRPAPRPPDYRHPLGMPCCCR